MPGQRIWLITSADKPKKYYLCETFIVDEIDQDKSGRFRNLASGHSGTAFSPRLRIDDLPWFAEFRRSQGNFGLGLQKIEARFVKKLLSLAKIGPTLRTAQPHIDPYLFQRQLEAFKSFVEDQSGVAFVSFASNPYTDKQKGYKYDIRRAAQDALAFQAWKRSDIGRGAIAEAVINAIQIPGNNLVPWGGRYGSEARPHQPLFEAKNEQKRIRRIEECFFQLYREEQDERSFVALVAIFGRTYPLLAYLFFLKDHSRYLPIAPSSFDRAFKRLGADFKTSHRCSWDNYLIYVALIGELKSMLAESLSIDVSLLDAHSFAWMLARQMEKANKLADVREYLSLSSSEREAVVKARIGQGRFRQSLLDYWSACAVTGCQEEALLSASHIKPWAKGSVVERLSLYNGLLLSPALDTCFDAGYITFNDEGKIVISERLNGADASALGIHPGMRLRRVEPEHKKYLTYHRKHIFKK